MVLFNVYTDTWHAVEIIRHTSHERFALLGLTKFGGMSNNPPKFIFATEDYMTRNYPQHEDIIKKIYENVILKDNEKFEIRL